MTEPPNTSDPAKLAAARRHMEAVKGFTVHAAVYAAVILGLIAINAATSSRWWVHWPVMGWGIFLAAHWIAVYRPFKLFSDAWEKKRIDAFMRRD